MHVKLEPLIESPISPATQLCILLKVKGQKIWNLFCKELLVDTERAQVQLIKFALNLQFLRTLHKYCISTSSCQKLCQCQTAQASAKICNQFYKWIRLTGISLQSNNFSFINPTWTGECCMDIQFSACSQHLSNNPKWQFYDRSE